MALDTVTVTGFLATATGAAASGWVEFAAADVVPVPGARTLVVSQPVAVKLVDGVLPATQLVLSEQPGLTTEIVLVMRLLLDGARPDVRTVLVQGAAGDTIDLSDLQDVTPS